MFLLNAFIHLLTAMFLIGLIGSAVVVTMAFVEDIGVLFGKDEEPAGLDPRAPSDGTVTAAAKASPHSGATPAVPRI
jgi:hypothetical protein